MKLQAKIEKVKTIRVIFLFYGENFTLRGLMSQVADFFANYWWVLLILVVLVVIFAAIRAVRRVIKEGGGAFDLETIKKNTDPNLEFVLHAGKAMLADADVVCEIKNGRVIPKRENIMTFRNVYKMKYKAASFYIAKENKVVYFFCKTEAGLQRRLTNLMLDKDKKNAHWPYKDKATAEHLRYPR